MKIVCPLPSDYDIKPLLDLSVKDYYFGYIPSYWSKNYSLVNSINRRYSFEAQCLSQKSLKFLLERYAKRNINFYITFNAPLYTTEQITKILHTLKTLLKRGLRGVIISDLGLIVAARKWFPHMEIHASCGTVCLNSETVQFLSDRKVQRIILPRSLSLSEIKMLRSSDKMLILVEV